MIEMYLTQRSIEITASANPFAITGEQYEVYMNEVGTLGIYIHDIFIPLAKLNNNNINWKYVGKEGKQWS